VLTIIPHTNKEKRKREERKKVLLGTDKCVNKAKNCFQKYSV
jgi:hypothetical protein